MLRRLVGFAWLAVMALAVSARADDPAASAVMVDASGQAAIQRALDVIDLVLEHHVQPPTRQEMVLHGADGLYNAANLPRPFRLSVRVSAANGRAECEEILLEAWRKYDVAGTVSNDLIEKLIAGVLRPVPGGATLIATKELRVQEQLQANRYVGVGIALGTDKESGLTQIHLIPEGPAANAGVDENDLIESIDGESTKGLKLQEVVDRLRGKEGISVALVLRKPSAAETRTVTITRSVVPRQTVFGVDGRNSRDFRMKPDRRIAYAKIVEIGGSAVHELRKIERELEDSGGFDALILDLRSVGHGTAHDATILVDALLDHGSIGAVRTASRVQALTADADCLFRGRPVAVIVGEHTGNTGEWVAASLQDNHRASIVGTPTAGNAFVYSGVVIPGSEDSLSLPTAILERPSGESLLNAMYRGGVTMNGLAIMGKGGAWGVRPDHAIEVAATATGPEVQFPLGQTVLRNRVMTVPKIDPLLKACEVLKAQIATSQKPDEQK